MKKNSSRVSVFVAGVFTALLYGCDAQVTFGEAEEPVPSTAGAISDTDEPVFMQATMPTTDAARLNMLTKVDSTVSKLGTGISRFMPVSIFLEQLHADHREIPVVVKHGREFDLDWCLGTKVTLELFDGQEVVVENENIRVYDGSWAWEGNIVKGGSGRATFFVTEGTQSVAGEIRLSSENRKLYIERTDSPDLHVLYERDGTRESPYVTDQGHRTGDTLQDLENARNRLEAELRLPGKSTEFRDGTQFVLDGINKRLTKRGEGEPNKPSLCRMVQKSCTTSPASRNNYQFHQQCAC